jgi:hypothetical protein
VVYHTNHLTYEHAADRDTADMYIREGCLGKRIRWITGWRRSIAARVVGLASVPALRLRAPFFKFWEREIAGATRLGAEISCLHL